MRTLLLSIACALFLTGSFAQTPKNFKYQAVARNSSGELITYKQVGLRISILKGSTSGQAVYTETHQVTTNAFGLVNLAIGKGTVVSGSIAGISWGDNDYFVKIEMDSEGGSNYSEMGVSQLLSVPYALYAEKSGLSVLDKDTSKTNELQTLSVSGNELSISNGNTVTLPVSTENPQLPKYTQAQVDTLTPVEGAMVYNITEKKFIFSDGASWWTMDNNCAVNPPTPEAGSSIFSTTQTTVTLGATPVSRGTGYWSGPIPDSGFDTDGSVTLTGDANTSFSGTACHRYKMRWMAESSCGSLNGDAVYISLGSAVGWVESANGLVVNLNALGTGGSWTIISGDGGSFSNSSIPNTQFTGTDGTYYVLRWTVSNATCGATTFDVGVTTSQKE